MRTFVDLLLVAIVLTSIQCINGNFEGSSGPNYKNFLYFSNQTSNNISAYSIDPQSGALTSVPGSPFSTGGTMPRGVAANSNGRFLYVTNQSTANLSGFSINKNTGALTSLSGSPFAMGGLTSPFSAAVTPSGKFLVAISNGNGYLMSYNLDLTTGVPAPIGSPLNIITGSGAGVAIDSSGSYAYGTVNSAGYVIVASIDPNTGVLGFTNSYSGLSTPNDISVVNGFVFVANTGVNTVKSYSGANTGSLTLVNSATTNTSNFFIVAEPKGRFLYAQDNTFQGIYVLSINSSTGAIANIGSYSLGVTTSGMVADPEGKFLYVASNNQIYGLAINQSTGLLSPIPGSPWPAGSSTYMGASVKVLQN